MNTSAVTINEVLIPCSLGWMGDNAWWHWTKKQECASLSPLFLLSPKLRWDEALILCCGWFFPCLDSLSSFGWRPQQECGGLAPSFSWQFSAKAALCTHICWESSRVLKYLHSNATGLSCSSLPYQHIRVSGLKIVPQKIIMDSILNAMHEPFFQRTLSQQEKSMT